MAFYAGNGDNVQTNVIIPTLKAKTYIVPGVTCRGDVQWVSSEQIAYYVTGSSAASAQSTPGSQQTLSAKGLTRKTLVLGKSYQLGGVIPGVNIETVKADQVGAYVLKDTISAVNSINEAFVTAALTGADAGTYTYVGTDCYADLASMRAEYVTANKTNGHKPTAAFVAPDFYSALMARNLITFKDNGAGYLLDMAIIECADLGTNKAVLFCDEAMVAAVAPTDIETGSGLAAGYPNGVAYGGEILYGVGKTELAADFTGKMLIKF